MIEEENPLESSASPKGVYNSRKICAASYLGGPLAAGYMIAENFKAIGERGKIFNTWVITITITVLIISIPFVFNLDRVPGAIIPVSYTIIAFIAFRFYQEDKVNDFARSKGKFFGWGRTIVVGLIGLLMLLSIIVSVAFLNGDFSDNAAIKTYGTLKHDISFDKSNITEKEVDKIADALTKTYFFDNEVQKSVDVKKSGNSYEIFLYCNETIKTDSRAIDYFRTLRSEMQKILPDNKIVFNLVIETPDNIIKRLE